MKASGCGSNSTPIAWELPHAAGMALIRQKDKKTKKKKKKKKKKNGTFIDPSRMVTVGESPLQQGWWASLDIFTTLVDEMVE